MGRASGEEQKVGGRRVMESREDGRRERGVGKGREGREGVQG